jgi:hypothetical protein
MDRLDRNRENGQGQYGDDITFILGSDHLTSLTKVYLHRYDMQCRCLIDLSVRDAFDVHGVYRHDPLRRALVRPCSKGDFGARTVIGENDPYGTEFGADIFLNPKELACRDSLAPFATPYDVSAGTHLDELKHLPALLFHELAHTRLVGRRICTYHCKACRFG